MNLPLYNSLQFPGNHIVDMSQGAGGIVVFNTGIGFNAFDLACPNHSFGTNQTPMTVIGIETKCSYDNSTYSLYTGQGVGQPYPMKPYRVEVNGTVLYVTN
jgi:nitrite reductase/ring-hydroxylating ferredoxin subunit